MEYARYPGNKKTLFIAGGWGFYQILSGIHSTLGIKNEGEIFSACGRRLLFA